MVRVVVVVVDVIVVELSGGSVILTSTSLKSLVLLGLVIAKA